MDWKWEDNWGKQFPGIYYGCFKDELPEGCGIFYGKEFTIFGEWEDGMLNGKALTENSKNGIRVKYECKKGKLNGNYMLFSNDGFQQTEYKEGKKNGIDRIYKNGKL